MNCQNRTYSQRGPPGAWHPLRIRNSQAQILRGFLLVSFFAPIKVVGDGPLGKILGAELALALVRAGVGLCFYGISATTRSSLVAITERRSKLLWAVRGFREDRKTQKALLPHYPCVPTQTNLLLIIHNSPLCPACFESLGSHLV